MTADPEAIIMSPLTFLQQAKSIVDLRGSTTFATWYDEHGKQIDKYSFKKLWNEAGYISNALRNKWNVKKGDLVVLCYDFGIHFFAAFLGCLRAGVTAVIVYPPGPPLVKSLTKMKNVIDDCSPALILTDSKVNLLRRTDLSNPFSKSRDLWPTKLSFQVTNIIGRLEKRAFDEPNSDPQDLAFLQYTSGSTGNPKGVMVTHSALTANVKLLSDGFRFAFERDGVSTDNVVGFSWLPQYHDLGLIECTITPFANGWTMHMMSPITFIRNPLLWVDLMSRHKVQWSAAPDFAYRLVAKKFTEAQKMVQKNSIPNLDLSSIHHLQNAAEPIRLDTEMLFSRAFKGYGLADDWFAGGYGLAETVVGVCWLKEFCLEKEKNVNAITNSLHHQPEFVAVGDRQLFHPSLQVKIVDPESGVEVEEGFSGEIWLAGPSITAGYYNQPQLSKETFQAEIKATKYDKDIDTTISASKQKFLRTGDKGFFSTEGKLCICGRYKDLIIVNGVNYYPQDIENITQATALSTIRPGCCAAFSSDDTNSDGELVIIFEIRSHKYKEAQKVCLEVQSEVSKQIGLMPTVVAIEERTICKTTSGKIQRRRNRTYWNEGKHKILHQLSTLSSISPARTSSVLIERDSDCLVIGAGVVGLCFARDLASLGYKVTIVEKSNEIGGTWANNDYHGLRLHQTGSIYRCLSLAPEWTRQHSSNEHYRPYRDEILKYCHELADHPNITVSLNSICDYEEENRNVTADGHSIVTINNTNHKTRFVLVSKGCYLSNTGVPIIPIDLPTGELAPWCLHSSQVTTDCFKKIKNSSGRIVVIGSGKAAIDILQAFDGADSKVLWAHRGHTAFLNRNILEESMANDGIDYFQQLAKYKAEAQKLSNIHPTALAVQDGYFLKCKGRLTNRRVKTGSGMSTDIELCHCDKFNQFDLHSIVVSDDGNVVTLESSSSNQKISLGAGDCIIFCTGQKNQNWKPPEISQYHARTGSFEETGPLNALIPLRIAIDQLSGQNKVTLPIQKLCQDIVSHVTSFDYSDPRELELEMLAELRAVYQHIFPAVYPYRMTFRHEWHTDWYGKDLTVNEVFDKFGGNFSNTNISMPKETTDDKNVTFDSFLHGMFGRPLMDNQEWTELDVASIQSVELSNFISKNYGLQLPPNFMDVYPTIGHVKDLIYNNQGKSIDVSTPELNRNDNKHISWNELMLLQFIGIIALLVMVTAPTVPAIYFSKTVKWYWVPYLFPIWMLGYTCLMIAAKWLVIGKYQEGEIVVPSRAFVRWWFIDRAVHIYNFWIGRYILGSPIQWLVYKLLGAEIHPSAKIDTTLQEFDLVKIDKYVTVSCAIRCSKFEHDKSNQGSVMTTDNKILRFRSIAIQANCDIDGHLSPGVLVGHGSVVESHSVVAEGGQVPYNTTVVGNPACAKAFGSSTKSMKPLAPNRWWQLGILKTLSHQLFLYVSVGCIALGFYLVKDQITREWRYAPIFLTSLSVVVGLLFSVILNLILKWIFIGKKKAGPFNDTLYNEFIDWFIDYHYGIGAGMLCGIFSNSQSWNIIFKLYGMDVDLFTKLAPQNFSPSKVDLIELKNSFTPVASFKVKKNGSYFKTTLNKTSLGWSSHVGPGTQITNSIVYPLTAVSQEIVQPEQDSKYEVVGWQRLITDWIMTDLLYVILWCGFIITFIPSYELCISVFQKVISSNTFYVIPVGMFLIVFQSFMILLALQILRFVTYYDSPNPNRTEPWNSVLYRTALTIFWFSQIYSILPFTCGTPIYNVIAKSMGTTFVGKDRVLFWGTIHDFPLITFEDNTIVDHATLSGHHVVYRQTTIGNVKVCGIVHPKSFVMADVTIANNNDVTGPWRAPTPSTKKSIPIKNNMIYDDIEAQSDMSNDMESDLIESSMFFKQSDS